MNILTALLRLLSHLPLRVLYVFSDICYPFLFYVIRYRRKVVELNLYRSFPELSDKERRHIEKKFYRWFCDYVVENFKLLTISPEKLKKRMKMDGMEDMEKELETHPFVFVYLGHYCNWEWVSSLPLWAKKPTTHCAQLYRPLKNKWADHLFYTMRSRFGSENISKNESLRRIMEMREKGIRTVIGFISDQSPKWNSIHDWVTFLNQDTPVFTGTERIGKKVNAAIYFADVKLVKRGYYHLTFRRMTSEPKTFENYHLTDNYMAELEKMICRQPYLWLWSHRRWKHQRNADGTPKKTNIYH